MFRVWVLLFVPYAFAQVYPQPEQIHLAFGENTNDIVVTWLTYTDTNQSSVEYGTDGMTNRVEGSSIKFVDDAWLPIPRYIHKVTLKNLNYNTKYDSSGMVFITKTARRFGNYGCWDFSSKTERVSLSLLKIPTSMVGKTSNTFCCEDHVRIAWKRIYHCGSDLGWSEQFWFKTPPPNDKWQPYLAVYGDLGNINAQSLPRLQEETQKGMYDAIFHIGDFAYNLNTNRGLFGDEFMRQIQPVAAYLPYMTCPGNHESASNFSHYKARFNMPGDSQSQWYSIDIGPMHVIVISTEVFYYTNYGMAPVLNQYQWLERELVKANLPENRAKQPWLVVAGHRPMYCSDDDGDDCGKQETVTRVGKPTKNIPGLEKLFYDQGVDLELWAHEHSYERLWPVYDSQIYNGSLSEPYRNPRAPVHIVSGSAGCQENTDHFIKKPLQWSAFRSSDYGYARLKAYNSTHLYIEQVSDDKDGEVVDKLWIIKDTHGPYKNP